MKLLKKVYGFFMNSETVGALVGKSVLLLLIPYAYLFLCGFIFDMLLRWYFMTTFIFVSLIVLYIAAIVMIIMAVRRYIGRKREKKAVGTSRKKKHDS